MLTAVRVAFGFCLFLSAFEEAVSWTIDLPQVRKYFFEKSLEQKSKTPDKVIYDNVNTHSRHFDYEKYREHYADDYEYQGYMEQKVHDAVRNGSAYLEGLRRAIEDYTRRLEGCQRMNFTMRIIQLRINTTFPTNQNSSTATNLPSNFTLNIPSNITDVVTLSTNFTNFMMMAPNFTMFNVSDRFRECIRADMASEHVKRLAELAIWAANELHDKMYADKYSKHGAEHHDDTLILRLAWFLDRLAHLTGYDPNPQEFVRPQQAPQPSPAPPMASLVPVLISNEDMSFLLSCMKSNSSASAPERCAFTGRTDALQNPNSLNNRGWPVPTIPPSDLSLSQSENNEYIWTTSEQDYAEENMPLSLPSKPLTAVKSKRKRSVQEDPLQHVFKYLTKHKAWVGSNQEIKVNSGEITRNELDSNKRVKRFIMKKLNHLRMFKPMNPKPDLSNFVRHKIGVQKDKKQVNLIKILGKVNVKPLDVKLFTKKTKRSNVYGRKTQPRIPANPHGDISYYVKNKKGTNYDFNAAQAALVRAGLEQAFQTGNIEVVRRYGSNYNPANPQQVVSGYARGAADV